MGLIDEVGGGPVGLDTCLFIYLMEEHPLFLPIVEPLFRAIDRGDIAGVTSGITLLEVLVLPYRAGDRALAVRYDAVITNSAGIRLVTAAPPVLRAAARLRAETGVTTPDALQLASALTSGCTAFVTNDRRLPEIGGMRVLQLSDYLTVGA